MKNKFTLLTIFFLLYGGVIFAQQASNVTFSAVQTIQTTVSWTNGGGTNRAAFIFLGSTGTAAPVNSITYAANTVYGSGGQIGVTGWYCIYNGAGTTVTVTGLTAGTTYRVMVCEYTGAPGAEVYNTATAVSNPNNQITVSLAPVATAASAISQTGFTANWNAATGAASYQLDVATDAGFLSILAGYNNLSVAGTFQAVIGLTSGTNYYYRVRAVNAGGTSGNSNIIGTSTVVAAPILSAVSPPTQGNGAVGVSIIPTLSWLASTGANNYDYQVSTDPAFGTTVLSVTAATPLFYNFTTSNLLINGVQYYWRVRATSTGLSVNSTSAWSTVWNFVTVTPAQPSYQLPYNGTILSGVSTTFTWSSGVVGIKYVFQISTNLSFSSFVFQDTTTNTYYTLNNSTFATGGTYYWRIIAKTITTPPVIIDFSSTLLFSMPALPQPIASYPIGNVSIYNNPPTLYWYLNTYNPNITQYIVRYRRSDQSYQVYPTSSSDLYGTFPTLSTNLFCTIPYALDPGYQYYWEVESYDGVNFSAWSSEASFTVYGNITFIICYPSFPVGGGTIYANPPTLYWYTNIFAPGVQYKLQYANNSGFLNGGSNVMTEATGIFTNSYSVPTALATGHWYWRVAATFTGAYGPWSTSGDFSVTSSTAATAPTPAPSSPNGGIVVSVTNPTLYWYAYSTSPLQYLVRYSTNPTIAGDSLSVSAVTSPLLSTNSYVLTGLTRGATYYWQVKSKVVGTAMSTSSSWSTLAWFTVSPGAAAVVPLAGSPINGTPVKTTSTELSWVIPVQSSSPMSYTVQYSKQSDFGNSVTISDVTDTKVTVNNLEKGTTYYWRAQSKTTTGSVSSYSAPTSFKTDGVTAVEEQTMPAEYKLLQNYPNPFNPTTRITYALPQNSYVTIKIYDMLGREVKTLISEESNAGTHTIDWNADNNLGSKVSSGMYIYRITAGNFMSTKKMVLIK